MAKQGFFTQKCGCGCGALIHNGKKYLPGHENPDVTELKNVAGKVIQGNNLEVMKGIAADTVSCVVTSPPY